MAVWVAHVCPPLELWVQPDAGSSLASLSITFGALASKL